MIIYLINIALIIFWRLFFTQRRFTNARKLYCGTVAFQWILLSGLRDWSVGADTYSYYDWFEKVKRLSWGDAFGNVFNYLFRGLDVKDPGYELLTKIFQFFFKDYQLFLIAIAILFMVLMARFIYKYSASPCTSFIIFSTVMFYSAFATTLMRQAIATALIVFCGYDLIQRRELKKFILVAFVSFLIHKSSLVFVPFYFLAAIPVTSGYKWVSAVVITLVVVLGKKLYAPIALAMGFDEAMINYAEGGAELYAVLQILLSLITLAFYAQIRKRRQDANYLFHATTLTLLSAILVVQNQSFMRIQMYYAIFIMITIPELLNLVKKKYRLLTYIAFGAVLILYLIRNDPYYRFCF